MSSPKRSLDGYQPHPERDLKRIKRGTPRPIELLKFAQGSLASARALLPDVASVKARNDALVRYEEHVSNAATALRDVLQLPHDQVRNEWRLTAQIWLVELHLDESQVLGQLTPARKEIDQLLRQGLNASSVHPSLKPFHRALQSAQVRFFAMEGPNSSGGKLAKSEIKRLCLEVTANQSEPSESVYHFLFLQHSISPSLASFDALLSATKARQDWYLHYITLLLRLHWALSTGKAHVADQDLNTLEAVFANEGASDASMAGLDWTNLSRVVMLFWLLKAIYHAEWDDTPESTKLSKAALSSLYSILDSVKPTDLSSNDRNGVLQVPLLPRDASNRRGSPANPTPSPTPLKPTYLHLQTMPRATFYLLVYLVSCTVNQDPTGRQPKAQRFQEVGLTQANDFLSGGAMETAFEGPLKMLDEQQRHVAQIKAELLMSSVELQIVRSKLSKAEEVGPRTLASVKLLKVEQLLRELITWTASTHSHLWADFKLRVTLAKAMIHHARNQTQEAVRCYQVVLRLDPNETLAQAGIVVIRLAQGHATPTPTSSPARAPLKSRGPVDWMQRPLDDAVLEIVAKCEAARQGRLKIVGSVIAAVSQHGIVKSKHFLSKALVTATSTGNNHIKPLVLSLMGNAFLNTRNDQAKNMFSTAWTMARSTGATSSKPKDKSQPERIDKTAVGNPRIGLWLGTKLLDFYQAEGDQARAERQDLYNAVHREVLDEF